jgi:signal recognition particle GTPase
MLAVMCERAGLAGKADRYRAAAIEQMRSLGDRRATVELLLADAPARALMASSRADELREAQTLAAEIGWSDGVRQAELGN